MALVESPIVPCNLTEEQQSYPCLNCLSESQLWMIAFIVMNFLYNTLNGTEITPSERLQDGGCNNCLSEKQILQALVARLIDMASELGYLAEASLEDASCAQCADAPAVKAALASLLCGIIGRQIIL